MAVWRVDDDVSDTSTHYSVVRPPGGAWGQPQAIVTDPDISNVQFAVSDAGAAVAVWADPSPGGIWASFRPAGGDWGAPSKVVDPMLRHDVAMSATGDAVLLYQQTTPGWVYAKYRPAGGSWGGEAKVIENNFQNTIKNLMVEFDGAGRTVAMASFNESLTDAVRMNTGTNGAWGPADQRLDDDEPNTLQWRFRGVHALVRHPGGLVAAWERRTFSGSAVETVVSRFNGAGWETPKPFAMYEPAVAVNGAGEILVAGTTGNNPETHAVIASSLSAAWPATARVSPPGTTSDQFRDPSAGGGGTVARSCSSARRATGISRSSSAQTRKRSRWSSSAPTGSSGIGRPAMASCSTGRLWIAAIASTPAHHARSRSSSVASKRKPAEA
jgi:hypothetical protein